MIKNFSPGQLAALCAVIIAFISSVGFLLAGATLLQALIGLAVIFLISYFVFNFMFKRVIYQKIKLIYKLIYTTKANKREETFYKYILPEKTIEETEEEVKIWAEQRNNEIESLRSMEIYRREFLQNFSHEIKTPLFAVQGYIDILVNHDNEDEKMKEKFLKNAHKNIERIVLLMNDIDEISRLESGVQKLNYSNFIIQNLIREVFESLSFQTAERNVKCSIKKNCESPPITVYADKERIRQVLINLVVNAVKYGKEAGTILAGIYKTDENHILVEITDDGPGIAEEHITRIFERFYRTDKARTREKGGTGLGLSICKHIIEAHGQTIHARSTLDVGTTVGFTLSAKK